MGQVFRFLGLTVGVVQSYQKVRSCIVLSFIHIHCKEKFFFYLTFYFSFLSYLPFLRSILFSILLSFVPFFLFFFLAISFLLSILLFFYLSFSIYFNFHFSFYLSFFLSFWLPFFFNCRRHRGRQLITVMLRTCQIRNLDSIFFVTI